MPLKSDEIVRRVRLHRQDPEDPAALGIVPSPEDDVLERLSNSGQAGFDLRLGRWLLSLRQSRATILDVSESAARILPYAARNYLALCERGDVSFEDTGKLRQALHLEDAAFFATRPEQLSKYQFVPFGDRFILHPGQFVLGITFEWLRFSDSLAGFVTGKSSWGRRGLIIETAAGIHPGFCGCLTLEIGNVGPVPIPLIPGMEICQVFFEIAHGKEGGAESQFIGRRRPVLGEIKFDPTLEKLSRTE